VSLDRASAPNGFTYFPPVETAPTAVIPVAERPEQSTENRSVAVRHQARAEMFSR
jgi:hypothetical protein